VIRAGSLSHAMPAAGTPQAPTTPPAMVNGVPYKPGSWDEYEDELLALWQKEFGNRYNHCVASVCKGAADRCRQCCELALPGTHAAQLLMLSEQGHASPAMHVFEDGCRPNDGISIAESCQ